MEGPLETTVEGSISPPRPDCLAVFALAVDSKGNKDLPALQDLNNGSDEPWDFIQSYLNIVRLKHCKIHHVPKLAWIQ